jgi:hypothetical protein
MAHRLEDRHEGDAAGELDRERAQQRLVEEFVLGMRRDAETARAAATGMGKAGNAENRPAASKTASPISAILSASLDAPSGSATVGKLSFRRRNPVAGLYHYRAAYTGRR